MKKNHLLTAVAGCVAAVAAAIFFIKKKKPADAPPKEAPQVEIKNPGIQSDFPPAPSGEKDLG